MNDRHHFDPTDYGCESRAALILALVDGQLSRTEIERLQPVIESDFQLRKEIERARCLRALVSTLPRVAVPAHVANYTERLARLVGQRVEEQCRSSSERPSIEAVLGALPIRSAPEGIADAVFARVRAARASRVLADRRTSRRRAVAGIAAMFLTTVTATMMTSQSAKPKSGRKFTFEVVEVGLTGSSAKAFTDAARADLGLNRRGGVR